MPRTEFRYISCGWHGDCLERRPFLGKQTAAFAKRGLSVCRESFDKSPGRFDRIDKPGVFAHEQSAAVGVARRARGLHLWQDFPPPAAQLALASEPLLDERVPANA